MTVENSFTDILKSQSYNFPHKEGSPLRFPLTTTYCDALGLPPMYGHKVIDSLGIQLKKEVGQNFAIIGTGGIGLKVAGLAYYDLYGDLSQDGISNSHNFLANDFDFHVLSSIPNHEMVEIIKTGVEKGAQKMIPSDNHEFFRFSKETKDSPDSPEGLRHVRFRTNLRQLTPFRVNRHNNNVWGVPEYIGFEYSYFRNQEVNALEIHPYQVNNPADIKSFLGRFQPAASNLIGSPMFLATPAESKKKTLQYHTWNPAITESKWKNPHLIYLTSPERFADTEFCIPQIPRVALTSIVCSIATGVPAQISDDTKRVLKDAVHIHSQNLSASQKEKAVTKLETILYRARSLDQSIHPNYSEVGHIKVKLGNFEQRIANDLDGVGWGMKVLGKTVEKYLRNS